VYDCRTYAARLKECMIGKSLTDDEWNEDVFKTERSWFLTKIARNECSNMFTMLSSMAQV
jgi:hypothetical protein